MMSNGNVSQTSGDLKEPSISVTALSWKYYMDLPADNVTSNFGQMNVSKTLFGNEFDGTASYRLWNLTWEKIVAVFIFIVLIFTTVVGNTLVILSVLTTRRLRTVTNCFVMNLAITDWLVGTCVMPPSVMLFVVGSWQFGWILCDIWISLDVLLCTASILSLCAISLDRYLAVIQPLTYSKKRRSKRLAFLMILIVWITALLITCPPFLGWYEPGRIKKDYVECRYNQNKGYVVFSAMGSFFIPLGVMLYVYLKIGFVLTSRRQRMVRDAVSEKSQCNDKECENFISESEHFQCNPAPKWSTFKNCRSKTDSEIPGQTTFYELVEVSRLSAMTRCSTISCNNCATFPMQSIHFTESRSSYSESSLSKIKMEYANANKHQECPNHNNHHHLSTHPRHPTHRITMRVSSNRRETKTAKTLTTVMGGFIACWLPFFCYYLLIPFLPRKAVSEGLMYFFTWVGWINCSINPFIYAFYNPDFRTAFWRLTFKKLFKRQSTHLTIFKG